MCYKVIISALEEAALHCLLSWFRAVTVWDCRKTSGFAPAEISAPSQKSCVTLAAQAVNLCSASPWLSHRALRTFLQLDVPQAKHG